MSRFTRKLLSRPLEFFHIFPFFCLWQFNVDLMLLKRSYILISKAFLWPCYFYRNSSVIFHTLNTSSMASSLVSRSLYRKCLQQSRCVVSMLKQFALYMLITTINTNDSFYVGESPIIILLRQVWSSSIHSACNV